MDGRSDSDILRYTLDILRYTSDILRYTWDILRYTQIYDDMILISIPIEIPNKQIPFSPKYAGINTIYFLYKNIIIFALSLSPTISI